MRLPMPGRAAAEAGFTLLELIVSLALTSLLTLVAYGAVSLSLKAVTHGQEAEERLQEVRVGETILERSLRSAVQGSLGDRIYFLGDPHQMRFFTVVPLMSHDLGGVYHWRVLLGQDEAGHGVLAVEQVKNVNWFQDPEGVEIRQIILKGLTDLHFSYGLGGEEYETWDGKKVGGLPDWVKVHLTLKGQEPLVWLIPIHVAEFKIK